MVGVEDLSSAAKDSLARDHLQRGRAPGEDRKGAVFPGRRRLADADPQGPAAAGPAQLQVIRALLVIDALSASWPGLSRPSTTSFHMRKQDVDARDKRGHDESRVLRVSKRHRAEALLALSRSLRKLDDVLGSRERSRDQCGDA